MSTAILRSMLGDLPILAGSARLDARGVWSGVVEVHGTTTPDELSAASIVLAREDGREDVFVGTVRKRAVDPGRQQVSVTVVAGAGKLAGTVEASDHAKGTAEIPVGLIARGICDDAGEQLDDGVEAALDARTVPHWTRMRGTGIAALDLLVHVLGPTWSWRFRPNGKVWVGEETWPAADPPRRVGYALEDGGVRYAPDGAEVMPGTTINGQRIAEVVYTFGPVRAEARSDVAGDPEHLPDVTPYARSYPATVVQQDADGTLELHPDDDALPDMRGIQFRVGIPGALVTLPENARVRVAFENADPRYPYAFAADQDTAATKALALVDDGVDCGSLTGVASLATGVVTFTYTPPGGAPSPGVSASLRGQITGPGAKYVKGVRGP